MLFSLLYKFNVVLIAIDLFIKFISNVTFFSSKGVVLSVADEIHPVSELPPNLPKVTNNSTCASAGPNCHLSLSTISELTYETNIPIININLDTGSVHNSANEIRTKMTSRQRILASVNAANTDFHTADEFDVCALINDASIKYGLSLLPARTLARYQSVGLPMVTGADKGPYRLFIFFC